jgi:hypothetical protein
MDRRIFSKFGRLGLTLAALVSAGSLWVACSNTAEGDRCNVDLSYDECSGEPATQCVLWNPTGLPAPDGGVAPCNGEAYCCPIDDTGLPTSSSYNCQALRACALLVPAGNPACFSGSYVQGTYPACDLAPTPDAGSD